MLRLMLVAFVSLLDTDLLSDGGRCCKALLWQDSSKEGMRWIVFNGARRRFEMGWMEADDSEGWA